MPKPIIDVSVLRRKIMLLKDAKYGVADGLAHTAVFFASQAHARLKEKAPPAEKIYADVKGKGIHLRRGRTWKQEVSARIRAIGVSALGWVVAGRGGKALSKTVKKKFGMVEFALSGTNPTVTLTNAAPGASSVAARFPDVIQGAIDDTCEDIDVKMKRWGKEAAKEAGFETSR